MIRFASLLAILSISAAPAQAQVIDQKTWDMVVRLASQQAAARWGYKLEVFAVKSVSIVGLRAIVDEAKIEGLPSGIEERLFTAINCDTAEQTFKRTLTYETTKATTVEISETIGTSSEYKFGVSFGPQWAKFNADSEDKQTFSANNKSSQAITSKVTEQWPEERKIPPKTKLYIKLSIIKGRVRAPMRGPIVFDAEFIATIHAGGLSIGPANYKLSDPFAPEPALRTTEFDGFIYGETFDNTKVVYNSAPVSPGDPECSISPNLQAKSLGPPLSPKVLLFEGETRIGQ